MSVSIATPGTIALDMIRQWISKHMADLPELRFSTHYNLGGDLVFTMYDPMAGKPRVWMLFEENHSREGLQKFINRVIGDLTELFLPSIRAERAIVKRMKERELEALIVNRLEEAWT